MSNSRINGLFTSESVSEGHPDKLCDQVSDAILDAYLTENPYTRTAIEVLATTDFLALCGEVKGGSLSTDVLNTIARNTVRDIGYEQEGFHWNTLEIVNRIHGQSADIAKGVDEGIEGIGEGAGDQGIMFGYACSETPEFMPAPIHYAHKILENVSVARRSGACPNLLPDAKSQVTVRYENGKAVGLAAVVVSTQHVEGLTSEDVREIVRPYVLQALPEGWMCPEKRFYVNPTGKFVIGGPDGDTGLTGRKIIVDTYGGAAPHGGGAFSGKDPTKVDRSAAYAARYLAKNIVAAGLAKECTLQICYAIGVAKPLALYVDLHGTGSVPESLLEAKLPSLMDLSPRGIRTHLQLNKPIYLRTATYGHFGRSPDSDGGFSWEKLDLVDALKTLV